MKNLDISPVVLPYHYVLQIADHCPKAVALYLRMWHDKDRYNTLCIIKDFVREKYFTTLAKFRHDLFLLSKEGLVSYVENPDEVAIELVEWDSE
jgi:hypothetical protein